MISDENGLINHIDIDDIIFNNDQLIVRGNRYIDSLGIWGLFVATLDTSGYILWHKTLIDTTHQSHWVARTPTKFRIDNTQNILLPNYYFNSNQLALTVVDSAGNEKFTKKYSHDGFTIYPGDVIKSEDKFYLFGRVQRGDYKGDCYILKTDSIGDLIWLKYYGLEDHEERFGGVVLNPNGTFTISSWRLSTEYHLNGSQLVGWKSPWVFTVDTAGVVLDEWLGEENDSTTLGGGPICKMPDENWAIVSWDQEITYFLQAYEIWYAPIVTRLDSNFNLVWKRKLFNHYDPIDKIVDIEYDSVRDEIVVCGHQGFFYGDNHWEREIWVVKLDGQGNTIWDITDTLYSEKRAYHQPGGLEISPSGSIYVAGTVSFDNVADHSEGWVMKVTADGCSDTLCTTTSIEEQIRNWDKNIVLYPNPFKDELNFRIKQLEGKAWLQLSDLNGRMLMREKVMEGENTIYTDLAPGMYLITILSENKILHSGMVIHH